MGFSLGIVGLPNVGKSTLFNALSHAKAEVSNYPFCTINPNVGVVEIPDERVKKIAEIMHSAKAIGTVIEFFDIAGLVRGAHKGEGLGNQFLSHIRNVDAIAHIVRCFTDPNIAHIEGDINPRRDIEIVNLELILADLEMLEKRLSTVKKAAKSGEKKYQNEIFVLEKIKEALDSGKPARSVKLMHEELELIFNLQLLTLKPTLYIANVDEDQIKDPNNQYFLEIKKIAESEGAKAVPISSKLESDIGELPPSEASEYLKESGISELSLKKVIREGYALLDLITFFTANEKEARAWTVKKGTKAQKAAGRVHSDMERGFIAAEMIHYNELVAQGSYAKAKEKGLVRLEGKDYVIQDGDLALFRFHV